MLDDWNAAVKWPARPTHDAPTEMSADVVVPVHGNPSDTANLLDTLKSWTMRTNCADPIFTGRIILVDDCSPDQATRNLTSAFAETVPNSLLKRTGDRPIGFAAAVNYGIEQSDRDVVLLNTDTRPTPFAIARLASHLSSNKDMSPVATVTPLTSAGFPAGVGSDADGWRSLFDFDSDLLDRTCNQLAKVPAINSPTGVGFCMAISRRAYDEVGGLDERARGYGEDTRFSLEAAALGFQNILALDTFVPHRGGGSFGKMRRSLVRKASHEILLDYPDFPKHIETFLASGLVRATSLALMLSLSEQNIVHKEFGPRENEVTFIFQDSSITFACDSSLNQVF